MEVEDHRTIWKEKNDLELMVLIQEFIEFEGITSVRGYQNAKKEFPTKVPSLWFINERFGSWENLQNRLGNKTYDRYRWAKYSDDQLFEILQSFIVKNNIRSQRMYEKNRKGKNLPSLSTIKKRQIDMSQFFDKRVGSNRRATST